MASRDVGRHVKLTGNVMSGNSCLRRSSARTLSATVTPLSHARFTQRDRSGSLARMTAVEPGPEAYACLRREYARRRRLYLRMLASEHLDLDLSKEANRRLTPATRRKYLIDRVVGDGNLSKAWARLRVPPSRDWQDRITPPNKAAKDDRVRKKATLWTDDPIKREEGLWPPATEDVNVVSARLAIASMEWSDLSESLDNDEDEPWTAPPFPPPITVRLLGPGERARAKQLVWFLADLGIKQMAGGDTKGKDIKEVLLARVSRIVVDAADILALAAAPHLQVIDPITGAPIQQPDVMVTQITPLIAQVKPGLQAFLDTLDKPVQPPASEERAGFISRWLGAFPGVDPSLLVDEFGLEHSRVLLELRRLCPKTKDIARIVDLHAWIAMLAQQPLRVSLPALSDLLSFNGEPSWSLISFSWILTQTDLTFVSPASAPAEALADEDDFLYRSMTCQRGHADPGWRWPAKDPAFPYWWSAILSRHCAEHLMALKETADFHSTDLLRFCYLFELFGPTPDERVPRYVADCIKASLLYFKYWFDEPPATGNKGHEMTFWSENHQILFHSSEFLVGQLFPEDVFPRSGTTDDGKPVTGAEHLRRGQKRVEQWLDRRLAFGFSEWNAPGYYNEDFPPVLNIVDFSREERLSTKAAMVADLLVFDLARNTCLGSFGVTAGRAYFEHKAYGWEQSIGETIEVLFGTRGDHLGKENAAIALATSTKYQVPDALLAIGRDRLLSDRLKPMEFRARTSINTDEARSVGVGFETADDAAFWWGCGAYFAEATMELTRAIAGRYHNLDSSDPPGLLFKFDIIGGILETLLLDTAEIVAGGVLGAASTLLSMAPFPVNLVAGVGYLTSMSLTIEGLVSLLEDLAGMIKNGIEVAWDAITGQDPPKPEIPRAALIRAWEAMLTQFNAGNILDRANLYTYAIGDAMLSSVQNHHGTEISFQKQPWLASLGLDACVWTNAPMDPGGSVGSAGWDIFKHLATGQASKALGDAAGLAGIGLDDIKEEGLRDWGGSICLPKVVQHRGAAIIAYDFPGQRSDFSATYTHAWFPCEFFDEVLPAPENEDWLPARDGGGTWVFGRKDDGYVALCSARTVHWLRDERFDGDPDPASPGATLGQGRFTSTELRAEDGSNIWVCAIGSRTQFGSFEAFTAAINKAYLNFSGVGAVGQLECTFDMPAAEGTDEPGFRWELFFDDDEAHLNGDVRLLDAYPRFEGRYVEGKTPGRVEWQETSYRITHPITGLWVSHDTTAVRREPGPSQECRLIARPKQSMLNARAAVALRAPPPARPSSPGPIRPSRARRFRLEPDA
ncbi:MAG: hypothetical protein E6J91_37630 [Deltaproteobacteria bacterium]|nr:MAG: hypothetical protein E6J91_37630 [Deltaproteobacteria bacterium]